MTKKITDFTFLDKKDTYAIMLALLYASDSDPNYKLLADLMYILDEETFKTFLKLFEGQTIRIPKLKDLSEMLKALTIYTYRNIQETSWEDIAHMLGMSYDSHNPFRGTAEYKRLEKLITNNGIRIGGVLDDCNKKNDSAEQYD